MNKRRFGGLWWQRDFRLLWIGESVSQLGTMVSSVAIPLLAVLVLHANSFGVGALAAAAWLPWLVIGLPAGAWVDRLPRRPILIASDLVAVVALASVPIAAWCGVLTYAHLLVATTLAGVAQVFFATAYRAYLPTLVAKEDLAEGNAKLQGSESVAAVAGPGIAGVLSQLFGVVTGLFLDALSSLVSAVCLLFVRTPEPRPKPAQPARRLRTEIAGGLRLAFGDPYLRTIATFGAAANFALNLAEAILVLFLIRELGVSPAGVGTVLALMSVGGIVGAVFANQLSRKFGSARALLLCELGSAPFAVLIAVAGHGFGLVLAALGGFVLMAGLVASNVILGGFRQSYCPQELLGRITASTQFVNYGAIPLGALLGGALGSVIGLRPTMWVAAVTAILASLLLLTGPIRRDRDLPTEMLTSRSVELIA